MKPLIIQAILEQDTDGTWWYVHIPKTIRDSLKTYEKRGIIHVRATIGATSWDGSLLPWADGSAQISINKRVRDKEKLELGKSLQLSLTPRD